MKTYLITGGAGFIGTNLTKKILESGNKVIVLDNFNDYYDVSIKEKNIKDFINNDNYKLYKGDIRCVNDLYNVILYNDIDVIIHLAALVGVRSSFDNIREYNDVNIGGTKQLLECARNCNVNKVIIATSSSVYGNNKLPFKEDMELNHIISPYAITKKKCEDIASDYHRKYDMDIACLRFFTVYGPHQRPDEAIHKFVRLMINNEEIPLYGDGTTTRDYTYVDDIVDGIIKTSNYLLNNKKIYEIFNLGSSRPISLIDLINLIGNELNINPNIVKYSMQQGDVNHTCASIKKAYKVIGYKPKYTIDKGVAKFIEWYKNEHK